MRDGAGLFATAVGPGVFLDPIERGKVKRFGVCLASGGCPSQTMAPREFLAQSALVMEQVLE